MNAPVITDISPTSTQIDLPDGRGYRLLWETLGEGLNGDYDENDPNDTELLRLDLWVKDPETGEWDMEEHDGSFCTALPVDDPNRTATLTNLAFLFAQHMSQPDHEHTRFMEAASHIDPAAAASQNALAALIARKTAPFTTQR